MRFIDPSTVEEALPEVLKILKDNPDKGLFMANDSKMVTKLFLELQKSTLPQEKAMEELLKNQNLHPQLVP